jgi:hypothetical protein
VFAGKVQHMSQQLAAFGVIERECGEIMRNQTLETGGNFFEELFEIEVRDDGVVDLQQHLKTVTLSRQCRLIHGSRLLGGA